PERIREIHCRTAAGPLPRLWEPLDAKRRPPNGYAAKFSLPYLLAVILIKGRAGLAEFTDEAVADEAVLALAARASSEVDPSIDYPRQFIGDVTVVLDDGRRLHEHQDRPRGGPDFPMSPEEMEVKFRGNAELALSAAEARRVADHAARLETLPGLAPLMASLVT